MSWRQNTRTLLIDPGEIDLSDTAYYLPCYDDIDDLVESVRQVGFLSQPVVTKNNAGRFIAVLGRRRLYAAVKANIGEAHILEIAPDVGNKTLIDLIFWDNLFRVRNNIVCMAVMTRKLTEVFEIGVVAEKYLPWIGVPRKGPRIERLKLLASLDERVLRALWHGKILEKTAALLAALTYEERSGMLDFIEYFGWNANKASEILQSILDISILAGRSTLETISEATARMEKERPDADVIEKASGMRTLIRAWKSKELVQEEISFEQWLENLVIPPNVQIRHAQSFESRSLIMEIRAGSKGEAVKIIEKLNR